MNFESQRTLPSELTGVRSTNGPIMPATPRTRAKTDPPLQVYIQILLTALATGITFNVLFGDQFSVGLNLAILMGVFFTGWTFISTKRTIPLWRKLCAAAAMIYAIALSLRASEILFTVNFVLAMGFTFLACSAACSRQMKAAWASILEVCQSLFNWNFGFLYLLSEIPWLEFRMSNKTGKSLFGVLSGVLISLPFIVVFGFLFSTADVQFANIFETFFITLKDILFANFWLTFLAVYASCGLLRNSFLNSSLADNTSLAKNTRVTFAFIHSVTVLTLLCSMFTVFVFTQLPYLFGGQQKVLDTPDLPWSEYARRGFFELSWVAILLIPTLMIFLGCTKTENAKQMAIIKLLSLGLSLLTGVIIVSALQRMLLYTQNYGLTELRIYVSIFIVMVAIIIGLLNYLTFSGHARHFVPLTLVVGVVFSLAMQVPNIQGLIVKDIVARRHLSKQADLGYLNDLSADAVPAIMASSISVNEKNCIVASIFDTDELTNFRSNWLYNPLSVSRARALILETNSDWGK